MNCVSTRIVYNPARALELINTIFADRIIQMDSKLVFDSLAESRPRSVAGMGSAEIKRLQELNPWSL